MYVRHFILPHFVFVLRPCGAWTLVPLLHVFFFSFRLLRFCRKVYCFILYIIPLNWWRLNDVIRLRILRSAHSIQFTYFWVLLSCLHPLFSHCYFNISTSSIFVSFFFRCVHNPSAEQCKTHVFSRLKFLLDILLFIFLFTPSESGTSMFPRGKKCPRTEQHTWNSSKKVISE